MLYQKGQQPREGDNFERRADPANGDHFVVRLVKEDMRELFGRVVVFALGAVAELAGVGGVRARGGVHQLPIAEDLAVLADKQRVRSSGSCNLSDLNSFCQLRSVEERRTQTSLSALETVNHRLNLLF